MDIQRSLLLTLAVSMIGVACSSAPTAPAISDTLVIEPASFTLTEIGDSVSYTAVKHDEGGRKSACAGAEWRSSNNRVATVTGRGKVIAKGVGLATIMAACGGASASASLQVVQVDSPEDHGALPAFPGAEGWGATALTSCNRSTPQVLRVTNLNDSGPGSLREAISNVQDHTLSVIVFDVAGMIALGSTITLEASCVYVAGQTAPGGGISITAPGTTALMFKQDVHDVVIRYLRFRDSKTNINVGSGHDIVIDHVSLSWATDKLLIISRYEWSWSRPIFNISVQRSLLSEVLSAHPTAAQISAADRWNPEIDRIDLHHNVFAHNSHRNPNNITSGLRFQSNVVYNWNQGASHGSERSVADWIGNYYKPGPITAQHDYDWEVTYVCGDNAASYYVSGNVGPHNSDPAADNWTGDSRMVACYYKTGAYVGEPLPASHRRVTPLPAADIPIRSESAMAAYESLINDVGANARLSCAGARVSNADAVDERVVHDVSTGGGLDHLIADKSEVGGFPAIVPGASCTDTDLDGMPDEYETRNGFNPQDPNDAGAIQAGRYSRLEDYLNGL